MRTVISALAFLLIGWVLGFYEKTTLAGFFGMLCAIWSALSGDLELARALEKASGR